MAETYLYCNFFVLINTFKKSVVFVVDVVKHSLANTSKKSVHFSICQGQGLRMKCIIMHVLHTLLNNDDLTETVLL